MYLDDIIAYGRDALEIAAEGELNFRESIKLQYAITHCIEVIGEAVKHIPSEIREMQPQIPWKRIAGMRDWIAHGYFDIDLDQVWKVIQEDLQPLLDAAEKMLLELDKAEP